ncbi:MAG: succinyldiaminopimelate transaminase, partial [Gammaproteobacteria bacterium HGW-Gammaproteobacteria-14]
PAVVMPNPFYQIYEGAALLAGGEPVYLPCTEDTGLQPDFDAVPASVWERCQLLYICSPGNPTGAVLSIAQMQKLIALADRYDFIIASDECYADIYHREPPPGLLQACEAMGRDDYRRCTVFHSLSKRSNLPGMRSGFVAGDAHVLAQFLRYRTYHGCAMPMHHQLASIAAWQDDQHAADNRVLYQQKFDAVLDILGNVLDVQRPEAGFYLWPRTGISDEVFARDLKEQQNVTVLPGRYLSREVNGLNPGAGHVRMALVANLEECIEGAQRIRRFVEKR